MTDAAIRSRVDELIAEMTPAEKAGQLTQYFYFAPAGADAEPTVGVASDQPAAMVEAALGRRRGRVAAVRHRSGRDQPAAAARGRGQPARHPRAVRLRRDPRAAHDPPGADRDGGVLGSRRRSSAARPSPPARRAPSASTGRSRRWSTSPATRAGVGSSRARARIRSSARRSPPPRSAASRATAIGAPERVIAGPKHFAGYGAALGGRDYDEVNLSDSELWNVYFPPFEAARRGRRRQRHDRLHGPQRHPGDRQPLAVHRGAARDAGASTASSSATPTPCATCVTHGFAADLTDAGARGAERRRRHGDGDRRPGLRATCPRRCERGAVSEETLDASVRRVLEAKLRLGLFDDPYVDEDRAREVLADPAHREVARIAAERSAVLLRNEGDLLPLDAGSARLDRGDRPAGRLPARHARAVGLRLRPRRDGHRAGRHPRPGSATRSGSSTRPASGRRSASSRRCSTCSAATRRRIPRASTTRPSSQRAVELAARRRRRGRRGRRVAEHDRRGGVAVVARAAGTPARAAAGRRRDRHAGRAAGDERPAARPALGGRARAGDPRHLVPRHPGRRGRREPAVRRRLARRQAAVHLAAHRRPGADDLLPHPLARAGEPGPALLGRGEHAAVPVRARPELRAGSRTPTSPSTGDAIAAGRDA